MIVRGLANKQIAYTLSIAEHTVKNHVEEYPEQARGAGPDAGGDGGDQRGIIHL
jgi:hypothetical protein